MTETILLAVGALVAAVAAAWASWAVAKRTNSGNVDTSDAASLWAESTTMRQDLRTEVSALRAALIESSDKLDEALTRTTELLRQIELANVATRAAMEETRQARLETAALRIDVQQVHEEVKTGNALTLGALADNAETRRIAEIPKADRTDAEAEHFDTLGIQTGHEKKETP